MQIPITTTAHRTQEEIISRIKEVEATDFLGFKRNDLLMYLDFEHAKPFLLPEATEESWTTLPSDRDSVLKQMAGYMEFAWNKANNCRGISAGRTMSHYSVWVWMIGDEEIFGDLEDYQFYGKDHLCAICNHYGWDDAEEFDNGERVN